MRASLSSLLIAVVAAELCADCGVDTSRPSLTVTVYDYAGVSASLLHRAEREATRILGEVGYPLAWAHCSGSGGRSATGERCGQAAGPTQLVVHLLGENATRRNASEGAMGFAIPAESGESALYCGIFYDRVRQVSRPPLNEAVVLGHAIAHELAHLLLGANAHSAEGLMSARWTPRELAAAARGKLLLSEAERRRIRKRLNQMCGAAGGNKQDFEVVKLIWPHLQMR